MRNHSASLVTILFLAIVALSQGSAQGQNVYIVVSSSISYDENTNRVNGVSQTSMDYRTTLYYLGRAKGYIYTSSPTSPIATSDIQGGIGQAVVTAYTQATASPSTTYNLKTEHYLLPPCGISNCGYYNDYYNYYYSSPGAYYGAPSEFGSTQTIYGCNPYPYQTCYPNITYGWIWMGNTNHSVRTPPTVTISNPRVTGNLAGTTRNALVAGNIVLTAGGAPAGGTYSWTFTGSPTTVAGGVNQASVTIRWTQQSIFRATVTYSQGSGTTTRFVDVNNRMPALTRFDATEVADQVNRDQFCSNLTAGVTYSLGCYTGAEQGIIWTATAQIEAVPYLSDPAESGIKFVQAVSTYRKRLRDGNLQCFTARSSETNVDSGWQLDTDDPYNHRFEHPPQYFSQGNSLTMTDFDAPGTRIEGTLNNVFFSNDAFFVDDQFEMYVFYFTGNPSTPDFQQAISLSGSGNPYARLAWSWGGQVRFDYFTNPSLYLRQFSTTFAGQVNASGTNSIRPMVTNVRDLNPATPCPGASVTTNAIDGSRFFTAQMYLDFLGRPADVPGLNYWRTQITQCGFDLNCVNGKRTDVARAFFYSTEFVNSHPGLAGARGTHDYNANFVLACYQGFLRREPNAPPDNNWDGFNFWVGVLDSTNPDSGDYKYNQIIEAFLGSIEYRNRVWPPPP